MMMSEESTPTELVFTIQSSPPFLLEIIIVVLQILFLAFPTHATMYYPHITQADILAETALIAESIRRSVSDVTEIPSGTTDESRGWSLPRPRVGVARRFKVAQDHESEVKISSGRHAYRRRRRRQDMMAEEESLYKGARSRYDSVPDITKPCRTQIRRRGYQQSMTPSRQNDTYEQPERYSRYEPLRFMPYPQMLVPQAYSDNLMDTDDDAAASDSWLPLDDESQHDMTWIGQDMTEYSDREIIDESNSEGIFQNEFLIQSTEPDITDLPYDDDCPFSDQEGTYFENDTDTECKYDNFEKSNAGTGKAIVPYLAGIRLGHHSSSECHGSRSGFPLRGTVLIPKLLPNGSLGFICAESECSDYDEIEESRENVEPPAKLNSSRNTRVQQADLDTEDEREIHMSENRSIVYGITERSRINRQTYVTKYGFLRQNQDPEEIPAQKNKDKEAKGSPKLSIDESRKKMTQPEEKRNVDGKHSPSRAKKGNSKKTSKGSKPKGSDGKVEKTNDSTEDDEGVPELITEEPAKASPRNQDAVKRLLQHNPPIPKDSDKVFLENNTKSLKGGKRGSCHS